MATLASEGNPWTLHVVSVTPSPQVMLASHVESGEEQCELLPEEVLVQHSVAFFLALNHVITNAIQ